MTCPLAVRGGGQTCSYSRAGTRRPVPPALVSLVCDRIGRGPSCHHYGKDNDRNLAMDGPVATERHERALLWKLDLGESCRLLRKSFASFEIR